jgi:DHA2 family multidrug resistance protein
MLIAHDTATRRVPVDYVGLSLLIVWVAAMQIMLDKGKELDWFASPTIVVLAVIAAIGFAAFLIWELTSDNPVVDLRIFRHRGFVVGVAVLSLTFGAFFASVVLIPLWLQTTMGYTATWSGYAGCLNGVLAVIMSPIVARMVGKVDIRALVSIGVFWMAGVALTFLFQGFFLPFFFVPTTALTLSSVLPEETAAAAGLQNFLRTTSAAFATSIMTTAWDNTANAKRSLLAGALPHPERTLERMTSAGLSPDQALRQLEAMVHTQAVMISTNAMFLAAAAVFVLAATLIWVAPKPQRVAAPGGGH